MKPPGDPDSGKGDHLQRPVGLPSLIASFFEFIKQGLIFSNSVFLIYWLGTAWICLSLNGTIWSSTQSCIFALMLFSLFRVQVILNIITRANSSHHAVLWLCQNEVGHPTLTCYRTKIWHFSKHFDSSSNVLGMRLKKKQPKTYTISFSIFEWSYSFLSQGNPAAVPLDSRHTVHTVCWHLFSW